MVKTSSLNLQGLMIYLTAIKTWLRSCSKSGTLITFIRYGLRKGSYQVNYNLYCREGCFALESEPAILAPKKDVRDTSVLWVQWFRLLSKVVRWPLQASVACGDWLIGGAARFTQTDVWTTFQILHAAVILGIPGGLSPVSLSQNSYACTKWYCWAKSRRN